MNLNNFIVLKTSKKYNIYLYTFFAFIALTILLLFFAYTHSTKDLSAISDFEKILNNSKYGSDAYLDITTTPVLVATDDVTSDGYYLASTGDYMYIVVLSNDEFNDLSAKVTSGTVRLYGTSIVPEDSFKEILINALNQTYSKDYTTSDYATLVGQYALDVPDFSNSNYTNYLLPFVSAFVSLILYLAYLNRKKQTEYVLNKYNQKEWNTICKELNNGKYIKSANTYITDNYILNLSNTFNVSSLKDVILTYQMNSSYNHIQTESSLVLWSSDGIKYIFLASSNDEKKNVKELRDIATKISKINKNLLVGYNDKNIEKVKKEYNIKI